MRSENQIYFGKDLEVLSFAPNYNRWILENFSRYLGENVAEAGAGSGNFSRLLAADSNRTITSFEPSSNMYPLLQQLENSFPNLNTHNSFLGEEVDHYRDYFDSVLYINVLEHVEDDQLELRLIHEVLNTDGKVIIFVPALSYLYSEFDKSVGHFRRYHKRPLAELVTRCGFKIDVIKYFDIAGIIPWYLIMVLLKTKNIPASVSVYDNLVVPVMKKIESIVAPPIGKNLLLVATKVEE